MRENWAINGENHIYCSGTSGPKERVMEIAQQEHIAITGTVGGKNVEWLEKVSDEQYNGK